MAEEAFYLETLIYYCGDIFNSVDVEQAKEEAKMNASMFSPESVPSPDDAHYDLRAVVLRHKYREALDLLRTLYLLYDPSEDEFQIDLKINKNVVLSYKFKNDLTSDMMENISDAWDDAEA